MADNQNKVIWCEGMLLQPHHFQQQDRYWQSQVNSGRLLHQYAWGFTRLTFDQAQLKMGVIALTECTGLLPDGSWFDISAHDMPLPSLRVRADMVGLPVVLALPMAGRHRLESHEAPTEQTLVRYRTTEAQVADRVTPDGETIAMQLGELNLRLAPEPQVRDSHYFLAVTRVLELRPDGRVVLDEEHIPPVLNYRCSPRLAGWVDDFLGRLRLRQHELQALNTLPGVEGAAGVSRFLFLQSVSRAAALWAHFSAQDGMHPEVLFRELLALAGEWAAFMPENRRQTLLPHYTHHDLAQTFTSLFGGLQHTLSCAVRPNVIALPLERREFGIYYAQLADTALIQSARLILAARAHMPAGELRRDLPARLKVGASERIRDMVNLQLPGLSVTPLQTLPHELPYFDGYQYFELGADERLKDADGLALHVAGEFPQGELALWAFTGSEQ
uniref:type VI secretion system baseplate subunit TssK n=1 Tax=Serratia quinivorans TaxID=137545 RepID=UPI0035C69DD0